MFAIRKELATEGQRVRDVDGGRRRAERGQPHKPAKKKAAKKASKRKKAT
jgi:hypothetical protein